MDVLYKYVPAERVRGCLPDVGNGTLRATQPSALNDPFEYSVMRLFGDQDEGKASERLAQVLTSINPTTPVSFEKVAKARNRYGSLYVRELLAMQLSKRFGIVSFATNPRHPLLWSHYTDDGSGFVIGYDAELLSGLIRKGATLRKVVYADQPPPILDYPVLNEENIPKLLSCKSRHWEYEREWRLIVELSETIGTGLTDRYSQPINLVPIPNTSVVSVYFTDRTRTENVEEVQKRIRNPNNRYGQVDINKLVLSETAYSYVDEIVSS